MRRTKDIAKLASKAASVEFPTPTTAFDSFRFTLRELLAENALDGDWEWEPHEQVFTAVWERSTLIFGGRVTIERRVSLDPRKPLDEEFARLAAEKADLNACSTRVFRAAAGA